MNSELTMIDTETTPTPVPPASTEGGRVWSKKQREYVAELRADLGISAPDGESLTVGQAKILIDALIQQRKAMIERAKVLARDVNLIDYAGRFTELRGNATEQYGRCPIHGCTSREDAFHVKANMWFCRKCTPTESGKRHDYFELVNKLEGKDFVAACRALAGGGSDVPLPPAEKFVPAAKVYELPAESNVAYWRKLLGEAGPLLNCQPGGEVGRKYLLDRHLGPDTWLAMGFGFKPDVWLPGTKRKNKDTGAYETVGKPHPAITIPWYNAEGDLVGIRARFLKRHEYTDLDGKARDEKQTAQGGSKFGGTLWGWHLEGGETVLIICEGEINAASIWQVTRGLNFKVLSLGSESQKLTPADIERIRNYRHVLIWMDRPEVAKELQRVLPKASAVSSPKGKDANDLLKIGKLADFLFMALQRRGWTPADTVDIESPETRDLFDFVGMNVDSATWYVITRRAEDMGWTYEGKLIKGGVRVESLHCPAPVAPEPADPDGDYMINPETGEYTPYTGTQPTFGGEKFTMSEWNEMVAQRNQPAPAPAKPEVKPKKKKGTDTAKMPLAYAQMPELIPA